MPISKNYWRKREEQHISQQIKDDVKMQREMASRFQQALDNIQKEIDANWQNFSGREGISITESKKLSNEMDVKAFARKAKQYVKDKDFSKTANDELRLYNVTMRINRLELLKSQIGLELVALSDEMDRYMAEILTQEGLSETKRQAGILGETIFSDYKKIVGEIVKASFHSATFSERIWGNMDALKASLDRLLIRSITQGKNPRDMARELKKLFDSSKYEAERLIRTESARIQTAIQKKSYQEYGIEEYEYIAEPTACSRCKPLDGKIFKVEKMEPGTNACPMHANCRCSTAPFVEDDLITEKGLSGSGRIGSNSVDLKYIDSSEFRAKFTRLTENTHVNDQLRRYAQAMLTHRNGTDGEDLYLLNASTGKLIQRKFGEKDALGVGLTKNESDELRKYHGNLIGIHNHPTNVYPTGSDYVTAGYRGYDIGVVVTHDGRVFKYSSGKKPFQSSIFDKRVEKYQKQPYNLSVEEAFKRASIEFGKEYGIQCEEI